MTEGTACAPSVSSAFVLVLVPGEFVELVAWMEVTDPVVVTAVAVQQYFVGAVEAKAVSAAAAAAAHTAHTLQASPTAGHNNP
jgi:hypothetical protein